MRRFIQQTPTPGTRVVVRRHADASRRVGQRRLAVSIPVASRTVFLGYPISIVRIRSLSDRIRGDSKIAMRAGPDELTRRRLE
jgi:hypothetical protein